MEKHESSDGVATTEFKRLRNVIRTQQQEIAELKASNNESCRKWRDQFEAMHQRAMKAERDSNELKAQVDELKTNLNFTLECSSTLGDSSFVIFYDVDKCIGYDEILSNAQDALDKTPDQCLASVIAEAELRGATGFKNEMIAASSAIFSPHIEGVFAVYADQLRDGEARG